MEWLRWFEGSTTDPKFAVVARRTGYPVAFVIAVWAQLLERASASKERGCIDGYDCEGADVSLGLPDGAACAIVQGLKDKGLIDEYRVCKWEQRQVKREREPEPPGSSTGRVREHRAKKDKETDENGQKRDETPCNDMKRTVTARNNLEERREEEKEENTYSASAAPDAARADDDAPLVGKKKKLTGKRKMSFLRFWEAFGDKRGKVGAIDAWAAIPELTDTLVERIVSAARRYATQRPELEAKGATPKMAQGWLTDRRWEDEPPGSYIPTSHGVIPPVSLPEVKSMTPDEVAKNQKAALERLRGEGRIASALKKPVSPDFCQVLGGV